MMCNEDTIIAFFDGQFCATQKSESKFGEKEKTAGKGLLFGLRENIEEFLESIVL